MPRPAIPTHFIRRFALGLATLVAWPVHAQPAPPGQPNAVSVERSALFEVTPVTGTLKETVQKKQQLVWRARRSPNERRFQLTDMSVAFLSNQAPGEVKITFAGHVSAFGWRPDGEPKLNVTARTRGGASIYSWTFDVPCGAPTMTGHCRRLAKQCRMTSPPICSTASGPSRFRNIGNRTAPS
jgi:hypothetical protein